MNKSNILRTTRLSRVFSLAVLLCCTLWAAAGELAGVNQLRFAEEEISLKVGEEKTLAVILDNDDAVSALNFTIKAPSCLEIVNAEANKERIPAKSKPLFNPVSGMFAILGNGGALIGNSGDPIVFITVRGKSASDTEDDNNLYLNNVVLTDYKGQNSVRQNSVATAFKVVAEQSGNVKVSVSPAGSVINPAGTMKVSVALDHNVDVYGLQLDINVPEGFTASDFVIGSRATNSAWIYDTNQGNGKWNLIIVNEIGTNTPIFNGNNGEVVSFTLTAPSDFADEVTVNINKVVASAFGDVAIYDNEGAAFNLTNGKVAHTRALEAVAALQTKLDEALAKIAETCPDVKDQFPGTAVAEKITALGQAVEAAYADLTLTPNYDNVMAPATDIENEIAALVDEAAKAQASFEADKTEAERQAANKAAYDADLEAIAALQKTLDDMNAQVAADYAGFDVTEQQTAAQTAIDAAKQAADTALAAVEKEGNYTNTIDKDGVNAAIQTILDKAKELKADAEEADRQAANKAKYDADVEAIAALQKELDGVVATIAGEYAGCDVTEQQNVAQNMIDAASEAAKSAFAAVEKEGTYTNTIDSEGIKAAIQKVLDHAKELKAELDRQAANKAVYDADIEAIAALQKSIDEMNAKMAAEYAGFDVTEQQTAAQNAIDAARQAADAALAAVETAGNYTNTIDSNGINDAIQAILDKANELKAEADRQAANKAKYDADIETIAALQKSLDDMNAKMAAEYAGFDVTEQQTAAQNAIDAARQAADAALAAVETAGNYSNTIDSEGIKAAIQAILDKSNVLKAEADRQAANKAKYDADVEAIAALQKSLDDMNARMAADYATCDVTEQQTAAQNAINAASAAADAAFAAVEKEGNYSNTIDKEGIEAAIQAILDRANELQTEENRQANNKKLYDADLETIAGLQKSLDEVNAKIETEYVGCDVSAQQTAAQNAIDTARKVADAVYAAVENAGNYSNKIDTEGINNAIKAILDRAAELKAELDREGANKAAYDADIAVIDALQKSLEEMNIRVSEEYPGCNVNDEQIVAQDAINAARQAADAALAAVENEGKYTNTIDNDAIAAAIQAIVDRAAELKAEADRQAANQAAYDADIQTLDAHQTRLEEVKGILATDYEGHDVSEHVANAQNSIDAAREAAEAAFAAVEAEGEYASAIDHEGIAAGIEAILDRAAELKAEAERQAANKEAYDADLETIAGLRTQLEEAVKTCDEEYPNYGYAEDKEAIAAAIDAQQTQADEAYAAVETEGEYSNTVDTLGIETMIEDMLKKAADFTTGVTMINGERLPADARIFTLDGREYAVPQPGKVNIVVYGDGTVSKVFVK